MHAGGFGCLCSDNDFLLGHKAKRTFCRSIWSLASFKGVSSLHVHVIITVWYGTIEKDESVPGVCVCVRHVFVYVK